MQYKDYAKGICQRSFSGKDDGYLKSASTIYEKISNIDIVLMQVRHIQYHVGHRNSILRDKNREAVDWLDYYGD